MILIGWMMTMKSSKRYSISQAIEYGSKLDLIESSDEEIVELALKFGIASRWFMTIPSIESALRDKEFSDSKLGKKLKKFICKLKTGIPLWETVGSCYPLFVLKGTFTKNNPVRQAVFLPLRWREKKDNKDYADHSQNLPEELKDFAEKVLYELGYDFSGRYTLHWHEKSGFKHLDFSGINFSCSSAWATLATGVKLLEQGRRTKPETAASASWDKAGPGPVKGLQAKMETARDFGCKKFCLYKENNSTEPLFVKPPEDLKLIELKDGKNHREAAVNRLLYEMGAEPGEEAPWDEKILYVNDFPNEARAEREDYIFEKLTERLAKDIKLNGLEKKAGWLVLIPSAISVALLSILAMEPKKVLLLETGLEGKMLENFESLMKKLEEKGISFETIKVKKDEYEKLFNEILGKVGSERIQVDLTGGVKGQTAILAQVALKLEKATMFHIDSDKKESFPEIGTEKIQMVKNYVTV